MTTTTLKHWLYIACCMFIMLPVVVRAQCPENIGFENGNFSHWECYIGTVSASGTVNLMSSLPWSDRHTLYKNVGSGEEDFYGHFPVNCPNGSGYSIRLGNSETGAQAERVSYTFTIPANQDVFSLIYNYAVVFQNPSHQPEEQPRFTANVFNVTDNKYITCSSFDYAASGNLPGFKNVSGTDVYYKPWSPVTIKLAGYAGKTIRLEFTTNDCTKGGHFGYAYLDIDENCTSPIQGNTVCMNSSSLTLVAPFGYMDYKWHDSAFSTTLGTASTLPLSPLPPIGTRYILEVFPYPGSGCIDTLYTRIALAPVQVDLKLAPQVAACAPATVSIADPQLRQGSSSGLNFLYYNDSALTNTLFNPGTINKSGVYYVKATNTYGCWDAKPIRAVIYDPPKFTVASPLKALWPNTIDLTASGVLSGNLQGALISYWKDAAATTPLNDPAHVSLSGTYYIRGTTGDGCSNIGSTNVVITPPPPPNAFSPNQDGINDTWAIPGLTPYPNCSVSIFDRYGRLVFESVGYRKPWDGTYNGKLLPMDTYYYTIKLSDQGETIGGSVMLLR